MKLSTVVFGSLMALSALPTAASVTIKPDNPAIFYEGRFDFSSPARPRFAWTGCYIELAFTGAGHQRADG